MESRWNDPWNPWNPVHGMNMDSIWNVPGTVKYWYYVLNILQYDFN